MPPAEPEEPQSLSLAAEFPAPTHEQWRELVAAVLAKGGTTTVDPEAALSSTTYDDITVRPLYTADDATSAGTAPGAAPVVPDGTSDEASNAGWDVRTRHADPEAERANAAVLEDLERGATSLWLVLGEAGTPLDALGTLLRGVHLDLAPVVLQADVDPVAAARALLDLAHAQGVEPRGSFGADPIGARARSGVTADLAVLGELAGLGTSMQVAVADGTVFHDAGASDAQEIGLATAVGVAYLRALTDSGSSVDDALAAVGFRWAVTADQFASIAKLRAARRVWARVAELCGAELCGAEPERGQHQHAVTSAAMLTRRDPWVNMLRTTIACFAAAVGGADAVTVAPFDAAIGRSDGFARRVARNTQAVLHDESSLARVADAAGGSWYVESFTDQLADAAWAVFTDIERSGGALAALDDGTIEELLAATRDRRDDDIAHRRSPITGVSEFAHVGEDPVTREATAPGPTGVLPARRYAEPFEALRARADAADERPTVFLATVGPPAVHSARAGFAANLFRAGGIDCVTGPVDEFAQSGAKVACLCSSDRTYTDEGEAAVSSLHAAGAARVWLAGRVDVPGVDGTLYAGCDALHVLRVTFDALGVPT